MTKFTSQTIPSGSEDVAQKERLFTSAGSVYLSVLPNAPESRIRFQCSAPFGWGLESAKRLSRAALPAGFQEALPVQGSGGH